MVQSFQLDINSISAEGATGVDIDRFVLAGCDSSGNLTIASSDSGDQIPACGVAMSSNQKLTVNTTVAKSIIVADSSWSFTPGATIYLGSAGAPTETKPTGSGTLVQVVGKAFTATKVRFDISDSYTTN